MSNPRKIDDHSSWVGKGSNGTVFPEGVKVRTVTSADGAGELTRYEDTSEDIKNAQEYNKKKIKSSAPRAMYR